MNMHCIDNINSNIFVLELAQRLSELLLTVTLLRYYLFMLQNRKRKHKSKNGKVVAMDRIRLVRRKDCCAPSPQPRRLCFFVLFFFIYYYYISTTGAAFNYTNEGAPMCIMCCGKSPCVRVFDIFVETTSE